MIEISMRDRVLAHLYRFRHIRCDIAYNAPKDITQEGVAISLGITRSHANVILRKMVDRGEVIEHMALISGTNRATRRLVYTMTPSGYRIYHSKEEELRRHGVDLGEIDLHVDSYSFEDLRCRLGEHLDDLGCLCVLRGTINRSEME